MARVREVFVCPPTHVELKYAINPWMDPSGPFSRELACEQWERLVADYCEVLGPERDRPLAVDRIVDDRAHQEALRDQR